MSHTKCHGCSLCLLSCPMWRQERDVQYSPQGIFKALQHNAALSEITPALFSCLLCGACDLLCPEQIDITGTIKTLRRAAFSSGEHRALKKEIESQLKRPTTEAKAEANTIIIPGGALRSMPATLTKVQALLSREARAVLAKDDGDDIALALEAGVEISEHRRHSFLEPLQGAKRLYVSNGLLLQALRKWLPATALCALGYSLSQLSELTTKLTSDDLYLIEARAFHLDHQQTITHYDQLRHQQGCRTNLDLQRNAIPTAAGGLNTLHPTIDSHAQGRWILNGHRVARIIVECAEDGQAMAQLNEQPVLHIADLMEHANDV